MRALLLSLRLTLVLVLAVLASGGWLLRHQLFRAVQPQVARIRQALGAGSGGAGEPTPEALAAARDKVDSLHGWGADSVVLTADEMASLVVSGLPRQVAVHLDSMSLVPGAGRVTVFGLLETAAIPSALLGPLAGALEPWEHISASGPVASTGPGRAEWRVDALTLRGLALPTETSERIVASLPGSKGGALPLTLPEGITALRVRPEGVALYRREPR
ncbi:MAG TPA: hypothetical protein VH879_09565 [Gemmatimonadales bacterium]|jgi:hypothetical protein